MTNDDIRKASGPQLIMRLNEIEIEVANVRAAYQAAADRECKIQLLAIERIQYEFRRRSIG